MSGDKKLPSPRRNEDSSPFHLSYPAQSRSSTLDCYDQVARAVRAPYARTVFCRFQKRHRFGCCWCGWPS